MLEAVSADERIAMLAGIIEGDSRCGWHLPLIADRLRHGNPSDMRIFVGLDEGNVCRRKMVEVRLNSSSLRGSAGAKTSSGYTRHSCFGEFLISQSDAG